MTNINNHRPCKKCKKPCYSKIDICLKCQLKMEHDKTKRHCSKLSVINHEKRECERQGKYCVRCGTILSKEAKRRLCWQHYLEYLQEKRLRKIQEYEAMK